MSRPQKLQGHANKIVALAATPEKLHPTDLWVKSVIIQGLSTNTDLVYVGNYSFQNQCIEPKRSLVIYGDNMDHGTSGIINLNDIYIRVAVNGEGVSFTYLDYW